MDVPEYPFDEQYDGFAFNSLLTLQESIQAITKVRTECNRVSHNMSLYHIPTAKPMRLEEFEQAQSQTTSQVMSEVILTFTVLDETSYHKSIYGVFVAVAILPATPL